MTQRTPETALKQYRLICDKLTELEAEHKAKTAQLEATRTKIRSYLTESGYEGEVLEWLVEADPALAWTVSEKSDGLAVRLHMLMDDDLIPRAENDYKQSVAPMKEAIGAIEKWGLEQLLARGSKGFKSSEGSAQLRTDTKYSISDKVLLIQDAIKNGYGSELTITMRPNSKFAAKYVEDNSELMPGVSSFREQRCIFVKG